MDCDRLTARRGQYEFLSAARIQSSAALRLLQLVDAVSHDLGFGRGSSEALDVALALEVASDLQQLDVLCLELADGIATEDAEHAGVFARPTPSDAAAGGTTGLSRYCPSTTNPASVATSPVALTAASATRTCV